MPILTAFSLLKAYILLFAVCVSPLVAAWFVSLMGFGTAAQWTAGLGMVALHISFGTGLQRKKS